VPKKPKPATKPDTPKQSDAEAAPDVAPRTQANTQTGNRTATASWRRFLKPATKRDRIITATLGVLAVLLVVLAAPYTRYGLLGQIVKRDITITVLDSKNHKPVTDAQVTAGSRQARTDSKGEVKLTNIPVGHWDVYVNKKYYELKNQKLKVPLFGKIPGYKIDLAAIGSQITVKLTNKITGKPVAKASVEVLGATAITNESGECVIVLPAGRASQAGTVKASDYNDLPVSIQNKDSVDANTFAITPKGTIYFLSKRTGKINVMKSNLDGSAPEIVIAGTGRENEYDTVLLATRDWKYLALKAKRDSEYAKLYLIETATSKMTVMDQGNVHFSPAGWAGHDFIYTLSRPNVQYWQPGYTSLKTYNADKRSIKSIEDNRAEGGGAYDYLIESIGSIYLIGDQVVYTKDWTGNGYNYSGKKISIIALNADGTNRRTLKDFDDSQYRNISATLYEPREIVFQLSDHNGTSLQFFEYEDGKVIPAPKDINSDTFGRAYPTFILSPSAERNFWAEVRDGKNSIFSGDDEGEGEKELAALSEFTPYGWYTDDYILMSKKGSELYIAPADMSTSPIKVTDYHKPNFNSSGYGGGYGGF
jgi:hypothetical protein